jgi:hypothetical protein
MLAAVVAQGQAHHQRLSSGYDDTYTSQTSQNIFMKPAECLVHVNEDANHHTSLHSMITCPPAAAAGAAGGLLSTAPRAPLHAAC